MRKSRGEGRIGGKPGTATSEATHIHWPGNAGTTVQHRPCELVTHAHNVRCRAALVSRR